MIVSSLSIKHKTHLQARVFTLAILSTEGVFTCTSVVTPCVITSSLVLAGVEYQTLIDVDLASLSFKSGARTVTFVIIDQVLTSPVIFAWSACTLICVHFAEFAFKTSEALTVVTLKYFTIVMTWSQTVLSYLRKMRSQSCMCLHSCM